MDFGKLPHINHIRFDLPTEDPHTTSLLAQTGSGSGNTRHSPLTVYTGAPIWTCPQWLGKIYPEKTPSRDYLKAYGKQFNSIELNSSFYRIPDRKTVETWRDTVPADFKFSPKLHQEISHFENLMSAKSYLKQFWESFQSLQEKLGLCFLQLPPHFSFLSFGALKQILLEIPNPSSLAVEFRHPSWFNQRMLRKEVFDFLHAQNISTVITDTAGRRDVVHSTLTTQKVLIRFVGNELHPTDFTRMDEWVNRLASWIDRGIKEIYFFIHQPTQSEVPELVKYFSESMNKRCGLSIRYWSALQEPPPPENPQLSLFLSF